MIEIKEHIALAPYTSVKIGGPARFFVEVSTEDELKEAAAWAKEKKLPVAVLGAGSNVLIADTGFDGLVIHSQIKTITFEDDRMHVGAGVMMAAAAHAALARNVSGFEWAIGIPGTIGGSVYGNAGCFGGEMKDVVEHVRVLQISNFKFQISDLSQNECIFKYRESIFKKNKNWIILGATIKLKRVSDEEKKDKQLWIQQMMWERVAEQAIGERTMGSTFKGILLTDDLQRHIQRYDRRFQKPERACWVFENRRGMLSAGFLIERAELKGKKIGGVFVSPKHANFLINDGMAISEHVVMLIAYIKEHVHRKFGIMLEEEIQYL
ncbi:MAG: UDP-N-acetylmuramate dehydrogenase [Parcubacteria group bacterium Gr01-1014_70]|nr:MAG: UDP-N-acetylmuramate dehydrogenase [Parcubacteria group bacterium Gr01-1014_70]